MRRIAIVSVTIAVALAVALGCSSETRAESPPAAAAPAKQLWRDGTGTPAAAVQVPAGASLAPLVKAVKPSVVAVFTTTVTKNPHAGRNPHGGGEGEDAPDFFQFFGPRMPREFKGQGLGSGFVINADGYVLTNNHVVQGATDIKVRFADGREFDARIVGRDPATDVALIQLEKASGLPVVALGDSDALEQGDFVMALGSPFGFRESVSFGIVSAKDRTLNNGPFEDYIQTDAAINQGNSGGPLFNLKGEVVGINTAIISPQIGQGLGFAVPINQAKALVPQLLAKGKVARGYLGVSVSDLTPDLAQGFGLGAATKGALVQNVLPGSPAGKAGVSPGDVVTAVDGKGVEGSGQLTRAVSAAQPGAKVRLSLLRKGEKQDVTVVVGQRPDEERIAGGGEDDAAPEPQASKDAKLGVRVETLTPERARELRVPAEGGVVVVGVAEEGAADKAGIKRGDVILEVAQKPVASAEELAAAVGKLKAGETVTLRVRRGADTRFLAVKLGGKAEEKAPAKK